MDVNACVYPPQYLVFLCSDAENSAISDVCRALNVSRRVAAPGFFCDIEITTASLGLDGYFFNVLPDFHLPGNAP
jgi:hypothetical protein